MYNYSIDYGMPRSSCTITTQFCAFYTVCTILQLEYKLTFIDRIFFLDRVFRPGGRKWPLSYFFNKFDDFFFTLIKRNFPVFRWLGPPSFLGGSLNLMNEKKIS